MKLPELREPKRYEGLYIFDFEGQVGVGYTALEIEILLESEKYRNSKVYKIQRAFRDGRLEIKGVSNKVFQVESGMFFHCRDEAQAREDYRQLLELSEQRDFPCRGISQVEEYYGHYSKIQGEQLWGVLDKTAREAAEVLANVGKAVVR